MDVDTSQHGTSRQYSGFLCFLPVSELIKLAYGATALEAAFERSPKKSRHWPSWKSLNKWVFARTPSFPTHPSSVKSLDAMAEDVGAGIRFETGGYIWKPC